MSETPFVSVVIPTYNRRERLSRVLKALDRQTIAADAFEVIVVDDGSVDGTADWLDQQRRPYAVHVIRQQNSGPARARNAGIEAAHGELLLFLDDDVEPCESLIWEHRQAHREEADLVVMGPLASLDHYRQPWVAWEQAKLEAQYAAMSRGDFEPTSRQFWTGNASVAREHVVAVGGFNTTFLRGEDVELGLRLGLRGLKFRFNAAARGLHHAERSLDSWERAQRSYGELEVRIFAIWGEDAVIEILAGNWDRLHPATRWLTRRCLSQPSRHAAATKSLRGLLQAGEALGQPKLVSRACGVLANLLYWQASVAALGDTRAERVFRMAEKIRQRPLE